jgi:hypothetical protein
MNRTLTRTVCVANRRCQARFQTILSSASIDASKAIVPPAIYTPPEVAVKVADTFDTSLDPLARSFVRVINA